MRFDFRNPDNWCIICNAAERDRLPALTPSTILNLMTTPPRWIRTERRWSSSRACPDQKGSELNDGSALYYEGEGRTYDRQSA
jgi:hypothetical protein